MSAMRRPAVLGALTIGSLTLIANTINYLANLVSSHLLSPLDYGELTSLLAVIAIVSLPVVDVMFGSRYSAAVSGVRPIVIAGTALAMILLMCTFTTAIGGPRWLAIASAGVTLQVVAISVIHSSPVAIDWIDAGALVATLLAHELAGHPLVRHTPRTM